MGFGNGCGSGCSCGFGFGEEIRELSSASLLRRLRRQEQVNATRAVIDGSEALLFSGNDYLGLAGHADVIAAGGAALRKHGASATASRLISGNHSLYERFERELADFKGKEAALVFPSGYMANLGCLSAVARRGDTVFMDRLCHASLYDGQRLSGSRLVRYRHCDMEHLEMLLERDAGEGPMAGLGATGEKGEMRESREKGGMGESGEMAEKDGGRRLIVTDGVFSMDGDLAPLGRLRELADEYGCLLIVDDAHGTGVLGGSGKGTCDFLDIGADLEIGTMSKAMGSLGGFVAGSGDAIEFLVNKARPFIFTTGLPASALAAASAALRLFAEEGWRRERVLETSALARRELSAAGLAIPESGADVCTPIIPLIVGDEAAAVALSALCLERGIFIPAVRTPAVPRKQARLRMTLSAAHSDEEIGQAIEVLTASAGELGII